MLPRRITPTGLPEVDVRALKREGGLVPGTRSTVTKRRGERIVCSAIVEACDDGDGVLIQAEGQTVHVDLVHTLPPFGGRRAWFACSGCNRRVAILYPFACRSCCGIAYPSQREPPHHRAIRRAQHHRMKLGASPNLSDPLPSRPWGMWDRTYRRRIAECREAEAQSLAEMAAVLGGWRTKLSRPAG